MKILFTLEKIQNQLILSLLNSLFSFIMLLMVFFFISLCFSAVPSKTIYIILEVAFFICLFSMHLS